MLFIAECGIENGLLSGLGFAACQSKNPQNPQSPKLPLYKEILQILPKLQKLCPISLCFATKGEQFFPFNVFVSIL